MGRDEERGIGVRRLGVLLGVVALATSARAAPAADLKAQIQQYRATHEAAIVGQLAELVSLESVAANPAGLAATADRLQGLLRARGFEATQLSSSSGMPPVVFGTLKTAGAKRTVVFYAHYDGQPVTPSQWRSEPFTPVMRSGQPGGDVDWKTFKGHFDPEWRLFGRAASDDKASIVAFLAAFDALGSSGHLPSVNIKVVWEGEEEANSTHLQATLRQYEALCTADLWLIGDAPVHQSRHQMLYFGARGNLGVEATIYGPLRALHDGHYGNWVPNPAFLAAEFLTELRNTEGKILIPGFLDDVRALSPAERNAIAELPPVEEALKREFGIGRSETTEGLSASTMRPALNVRGIRSGQVGAERTNSIPIDAVISMDFRLVPDQTPASVRAKVESFLRAKGWTLVSEPPDLATRLASARVVQLSWEGGYRALRTDMTTPVATAVIATATRSAGHHVALLPMMGGSVPLYLIDEVFRVPVIGLPIVNHDNNQHAANENLRLQNLWDGIEMYAAMMSDLSW
jgi:acetylornithine deacetylase/succinyl-diaminopimelate desuccinylase-like protein